MYYNIFCGIFFLLAANSYFVSTGHWILDVQSPIPRNSEDNISEVNNETDLSADLINNDVSNTTENDSLFWTTLETNDTIEADSEIQIDTNAESEGSNNTFQMEGSEAEMDTNGSNSESQTNLSEAIKVDNKLEENSDMDALQNNLLDFEIDEKIVLQRNNCDLEIAVEETQDLKLFIRFGKLENNTTGKCCITLNGKKNSLLAVLISNVYLYQNEFQGEVLKVITADYGSNFILKEYYSWMKYEPMLLTNTHKVYLVLYYKVANVSSNVQDSHFNLEVISYNNYESQDNSYSHYSYDYNAPKLPESEPFFAPYFY